MFSTVGVQRKKSSIIHIQQLHILGGRRALCPCFILSFTLFRVLRVLKDVAITDVHESAATTGLET